MGFKKIVSFFMIFSFLCEKVCAISHLDVQEDRSSFVRKKEISRNSPSRKLDPFVEKGTVIEETKKSQALKLEKRKIWATFLLERKRIQERSKLERKKIRAAQKKAIGLSPSKKKTLKKQKKAAIRTVKRKEYIELKQAEHTANQKIAALGRKNKKVSPIVTPLPEKPEVKPVVKAKAPAKPQVKPVVKPQAPAKPEIKKPETPAKPEIQLVKAQVPEKPAKQPVKETKASMKLEVKPAKKTQVPEQLEVKQGVKPQIPEKLAEQPVKKPQVPEQPAKQPVKETKASMKFEVKPAKKTQAHEQPARRSVKEIKASVKLEEKPVKKIQAPVIQSITPVAHTPVENERKTFQPKPAVIQPITPAAHIPVEDEVKAAPQPQLVGVVAQAVLQPVNMAWGKEEESEQSQEEEHASEEVPPVYGQKQVLPPSWRDESQESQDDESQEDESNGPGFMEREEKEEQPIDETLSQTMEVSAPVAPQLLVQEEMEKAPSSQSQSEQLTQNDNFPVAVVASPSAPMNGKVEEEEINLGVLFGVEEELQLRQEEQQQRQEEAENLVKEARGRFKELERTAVAKAMADPFLEGANEHVKTKEEKEKAIRYLIEKIIYPFVADEEKKMQTTAKKIQDVALGEKTQKAIEDTQTAIAIFKSSQQNHYDTAVNYFAWLSGAPVQEAEQVKVHQSDDKKNNKTKEDLERQFLGWLKSSNPKKEDLLKTLAEKFLQEQKDPARKLVIQGGARLVINNFVKDTNYTHKRRPITSPRYKELLEDNVTLEGKVFKKTFVDLNGDKKESIGEKVLKRILTSQGSSPVEVHIFSDSSQEVFRFILLGDKEYATALLLEPVQEAESAKTDESSRGKKPAKKTKKGKKKKK